jgi:alpha-D-ribose 1-methylphosphonate 5-triphosphate synthase subunit PhnH
MPHHAQTLSAGFEDPVLQSQASFHALMHAMARPGVTRALPGIATAPAPLHPVMAAVALTVLDFETMLWCDAAGDTVEAWLKFHTGTKRAANPSQADFALITRTDSMPALADWKLGTDTYPDRSTTLVLPVRGFGDGPAFRFTGPGIEAARTVHVDGLPSALLAGWGANRALFPRGVDVILTGPDMVMCLPRTLRIEEM